MKKILLPILFLLIVGLSLISCEFSFGEIKNLIYLDVTVSPTDYKFSDGDNVKEHLTVKSYYSDGSEQTVTDYSTNLTDDKVTSTTNSVTVSYTESDVTKTKTIPISIKDDSKTLISIDVTSDKYVFEIGDDIKSHLTVKGFYSDGSEQIISNKDYTVSPTDFTITTEEVTVTYGTKTKTIPIFLKDDSKTLYFIDVTLSSSDYVFSVGDNVKDHLTVKGYYSDGSEQTVTDYSTDLTDNKVTSTTNSVTVSYTESDVTKTKTIPISVDSGFETLESIEVLKLPTKTTYYENEEFDVSGLVVVGLYSDGSERIIKDYTLSLKNGESVGTVSGTDLTTKTNIITYESKTTSFDIYVEKSGTLDYIKITSLPTHLIYNENLLFDKSGLKVVGVYTDGSEVEICGYSLSIPNETTVGTVSGTDLTTTKTNVVSFNGKETSFEICVVKYLTLNSIEIKTSPTKTTYYENEEFDDSGLVVVGLYSDGSERIIKDYTLSLKDGDDVGTVSGDELTTKKTNTVKYEGKETSFDFYVERILERIEVQTPPSKTNYTENSIFDVSGLKIIGVYSKSLEKEITDYTLSIPNEHSVGTVSGTELTTTKKNTVTYKGKTTSFDITVEKSGTETLESIEILKLPTKIIYREGTKFDDSGLMVIGIYSGNNIKVITDYTLSIPNGTNVGNVEDGKDHKTLTNTVTYNGNNSITTSFEITVKKVPLYTMTKGTEWVPPSSFSSPRWYITKIVFDYTDDLPQDIKDNLDTSTPVGNTGDDLIYRMISGTELYVFSDGTICGNSDCKEMFSQFSRLEEITFNNFNTTNVTNMSHMFDVSDILSLDLSNFDTSNVTDMSYMFSSCSELTSLDLSKFDTSSVSDMRYMFSGCEKLTSIDFSSFNTSKVTKMVKMFYNCQNLTSLNLSNFGTSKVTDMSYMFERCENLTTLDLSSFNIKTMTTDRPSVGTTDMFNLCGKNGTTVTINPNQKDKFDSVLSGWSYTSSTDLGTYTKN